MIVEYIEFLKIMEEVWNIDIEGIKFYKFWMKLKVCKKFFKVLYKVNFGSVDIKVNDVRNELSNI